MRFFWVTFYFLVFFKGCFSVDGLDSNINKCIKDVPRVENPLQQSQQMCDFFKKNFSNCVEKNIYDSEKLMDQLIVRNINIKNLKNFFAYVCSKVDTLTGENLACISKIKTCMINLENLSLKCFNDIIPCVYKTMLSCSPKGAMIFSKALTMVKSSACKLSSYRYNLEPFYGPDLDCYPKVKTSSGIAAANLGLNYMFFCNKFNKENVSQCIEDNLLSMKKHTTLDNDYTQKVKEFFRQRSNLCEYLTRLKPKTCSSLNALSCQEDLYKHDSLTKPFDVLLRSYADCVYEKYKTCDTNLAKIIKRNLIGNKSNSLQFSVPLVCILSQLALVITILF